VWESDERTETKPSHVARGRGNGAGQAGAALERGTQARRRPRLLRGESIDTVSRQIGIEPFRLEQWRDRGLAALDAGLKERPEDDPLQAGLGAAYKRLGELGMENELLREKIARLEGGVPFHRARSRK
jgi:transposase